MKVTTVPGRFRRVEMCVYEGWETREGQTTVMHGVCCADVCVVSVVCVRCEKYIKCTHVTKCMHVEMQIEIHVQFRHAVHTVHACTQGRENRSEYTFNIAHVNTH